jgi:hypothetical protein
MLPRERTQRTVQPGVAHQGRDAKHEVIALRLADIIDRLPAALLVPGEHDPSKPLTFQIADIAKQIAEGRPNIELTDVYRQMPSIFAGPIKASDGLRIRFPWQMLVEMIRAASNHRPISGLTHAGALHLARLLRGRRNESNDRTLSKFVAGAAALARAPQWFSRNVETGDTAADNQRLLNDLATALEQFAPAEESESASVASTRIASSDALAIATEENTRLRRDVEERDLEIESLRKTLSELESAAIDQIAALNQQCEEYEAAKTKQPAPIPAKLEETPLNPQQTAMIESLTQQVAELFSEVDRAREESLQATAAHAKYREQQEVSSAAAGDMEQYLGSVAYELERANAVLKEMEAKVLQAEKIIASKDEEIQRLRGVHSAA